MTRPRRETEETRGRSTARTGDDERFAGLPTVLRDWLANQPGIARLLLYLEECLRNGTLTHERVVELAKRWSVNLPPRRGVLVTLHRAAQPELPIDLPPLRRIRRKPDRKKPRK